MSTTLTVAEIEPLVLRFGPLLKRSGEPLLAGFNPPVAELWQ